MRNDKNTAIELRKNGNSYNQINKELGISKSTLSYWLKDIKLSKKAKQKIENRVYSKSTELLIRRNKEQTIVANQKADKICSQAKLEVNKLIKNNLFTTGVSLYWAEGYKKGAYGSKWKCVDFANSDPEMVKIMMKFFKETCNVEINKIKAQIIAHPNININKAIVFWSELTGITKNNFIKTCCSISKYSNGKRNANSLNYGTVHIRICDVKLFFRLIGWIEGLKLHFNK